MERLMVIRLAGQGCTAEAWLNGLSVARVTPAAPLAVVPAHEAALVGANRLELVVGADDAAAAALQTAPHAMAAQLHLLLPRIGGAVDETSARTLAQLEWTCAAGEALALPVRQVREADLPIRFPRWRWLDAPVVQPTPALLRQAHAFVSGLARDLARGQTESFMAATRLRTEELALAYQRSPESESARVREWLEQMYAASRLVWQPLAPEDMQLRPLAGSRLLECLGRDGTAALTTMPDKGGNILALPLKVSVVEGRFYVLR
ncbi:MAG: hypothetical protein M3Y55_17000 [Pseudomonadota bacterium]|nr:hypothetical protein [Pseudomonadota bacterium]